MAPEPTLNDLMERHAGAPVATNREREQSTDDGAQNITSRMLSRTPKSHLDELPDANQEEDSWVTTYMDLLTLLLVLFVVLLANADLSGDKQSAQPSMAAQSGLGAMQSRIQEQFAGAGLGDSVNVSLSPGKLNIRLNDKILFDSGEAEFNQQAARVMQPLLSTLADSNLQISVEGHTDNIPISTARFPSNWELSAARAISVVRFLQNNGIAAQRLRAIGYADSQPLQPNDTAEGRSENRRVNLILTEAPTSPEE
ncbi:chemotaxis protein MotB [Pseudidiomarina maritima]|jgi:Flagellar motor protein|uniref:Chemotaxis protein MotB n=1 Tax=Pseudidiomarina maritima TaxID=519453 RepID=A0A1I6HG80_9GAMM|nr:OmpA family protein [Pseudidiomarina maritima]SFR53320.1 chemotaxis protein MotB [Pseudidiomarina maritima]